MFVAWVPFPEPGGPIKITLKYISSVSVRLTYEAFVIPHQQLGFKLAHCVQRHSNHDEKAGAAERERSNIRGLRDEVWDDRDDPQEQRPSPCYADHDSREVVLRRLSWSYARYKTAVSLQIFRQVLLLEYHQRVEEREYDH